MPDVGSHEAAGAPLRRARTAAWIVTVAMGGTTMAFQVYHSVKHGHMPWELAALYGVAPLLIAVLVLEIVAEWRLAPWAAKAGAYLIMGAAMFLSASATGDVVLAAAPPHFSLLFGALLDGAELLAAYFIMNGPSAAQAVAAVAAREAELLGRIDAERSGREQDRTAIRAEADRLLAQAEAGLRAAAEERDAEVASVRAETARQLEAERTARETVESALSAVRSEAERAAARAEVLARKLESADRKRGGGNGGTGSRKQAGSGTRKPEAVPDSAAPKAVPGGVPEAPPDLDAESAVLWYVDQGLSASAAGVAAGLSDSRGRQIVRKLTAPAPAGIDPVTGGGTGGSGAEAASGND